MRARVLAVLGNVRTLSLSWTNPKSKVYHSDSVKQVMNRALDDCLNFLRKDSEWSLYQWDVVRNACDIAMFLYEDLSTDQSKMLHQFLKDHRLRNTSAIKASSLSDELEMHYGVLINDLSTITSVRDRLAASIEIGDKIQKDLSFHDEGRLAVFNPNGSFLLDQLRVAWQLRNTSLKFPREKIVLLTDVIINAWHLMTRGLYTVPAPLGIYSSKENALKPTDLREYVQMMKELCPERSDALTSLQASLNGEQFPKGIYHWPSSDFTAIHESNFSFFIKTNSNRTTIASPEYPENLKGKILGSGDAYVVRDGLEYFNMMPAWNWKYVPGTTSFTKAVGTIPQSFLGNVSYGKSSLTAMKLNLTDSLNRQQLSAHKFWASHDGMIISLVGNIKGNISGSAYTTIDQCRWRGDVTVNRPGNVLKAGSHRLSNVSWIHHASFVYITMPFYPTNMNFELKEITGNWRSVSHSQPEKKVTENVFTSFIDHGHITEEGYNGYVIAYAPTVAEAQAIAAKPQWRVMRNSQYSQGVYFLDGTAMVAFYSGNSPITYENKLSLEASEPCLVLIEDNRIFVSSIDATSKKIRIKWNDKVFSVITSPLGNAVEGQTPDE